jgi:AbrB family looped-hinge helix DNA binding protein
MLSYQDLTVDVMDTTRLSAKGQVVLPKRVRDAHGWEPGVEFIVESTEAGVLLRPRTASRTGSIAALAGLCKVPGRPPVTVEAMDKAISAEVKARRARGRY